MAEIVQKRMESMTREFEDMYCTKLYTMEEIRHTMKRRKDFEYKIHGINKNLQDFKEYIYYEQCLLRDVSLRRDKYKIGEKKDSIEYRIIKRIREIYQTAIQYFPGDISIFFQFFKFCKQVNCVNATNNIVMKMIQQHPNEEKVWYMAAGWYAYDCKDITKARTIILKGLSIHKDYKLLYKEAIQMELFFTVGPIRNEIEKQEEDEKTEEEKLCIEKIKVYLKFAFESVKCCEFYIEILDLLEKYRFTMEIQKITITHMLDNFSNHELLWHKLAQREKKGLHYASEGESESKNTTKGRLLSCIKKYQEGLQKVSKDKKEKLWSLYLDSLIESQHDSFEVAKIFRSNCLKAAFQQASEEGYMNERYYMAWLECVNDNEALQILEKGTETLPQSVFLWKSRLRYLTLKDDPEEVGVIFKKGREALQEKALPLWNAIIRYHLLTSNNDLIELIYKDGIKQPPEVSETLKSQYLEWLAVTKDLKATRKAYNAMALEKPYSKKLHLTMSKLEAMETEPNIKAWEKVHQLACEQFGKEDVDVWINYTKFFLHFNKGMPDLNERLSKVYEDALKNLPLPLQDEFIERFNTCKESVAVDDVIMHYFSSEKHI